MPIPNNPNPPNPSNDGEKFATYTRDNATGLDYAYQRYYDSVIGRFTQPDPFVGSFSTSAPQTFNRYSYAGNDPRNYADPEGTSFFYVGHGNSRGTFWGSLDFDVSYRFAPVYAGVYVPVIFSAPSRTSASPLTSADQAGQALTDAIMHYQEIASMPSKTLLITAIM